MRRFLKGISILAMALVLLNTFSGCSNSKNLEKELRLDSTGEKIQSSQDFSKEVTLRFYTPGVQKADTKDVLDQVAAKSNLNIRLEFKCLGNEYFEKMKTAFAANEDYDGFYVGRKGACNFDYTEMARNGELKDLTTLLPQFAPKISKQLSTEELRAAKIDGKLVVVPNLFPQASWLSVTVRKDLLEKYKMGPIKTFQDYGRYLKAVKENEPNLIPGTIGCPDLELFANAYGYVILDVDQALVYKWDDPDQQVIPWEKTPEFQETAYFMTEWIQKGYLSKPEDGVEKERASFLGNNNVTMDGPTNFTFGGSTGSKEYKNMYNYTLYDQQKVQKSSPIGNIYIKGAIAFNAKSPNVDRALMFLDLIQSNQQLYDLFIYGIKDKHYALKNERIQLFEDDPFADSGYSGWLSNPFQNLELSRLPMDDSLSDNAKEDYREFLSKRTLYAPHEGFYPDYRNLKNETQTRASIIQSSIWMAFYQGNFDVKNMNGLISELEDAGTDHIVVEVQKQLNQWRKENKK